LADAKSECGKARPMLLAVRILGVPVTMDIAAQIQQALISHAVLQLPYQVVQVLISMNL